MKLALLLLFFTGSTAYVTSPGAVPVNRQRKFLKQLTSDLCQVTPGKLSTKQLSQCPQLIYAWSHLGVCSKENALAVESLVKRVIDERRAGNEQADLTVEDYNCLLEGWARSRQGEAAAERCEEILTAMQAQGPKPDLLSFKAVLMAWRHVTEDYSALRAQRILEWMLRLYKDGENDEALPDADCFDAVLQTWSRSGHRQAPQEAEKLLGVMERLYESTGLIQVKPRTLSFNAVLAAWSRSGQEHASDRASKILAFMELLKASGDKTVAPDSASYCTVMGALAKSENQALAASKAGALLRHVEVAYYGSENIVPDTILFNTAMGCWAKSNLSGAYRQARSILDRQIALYESGCSSCKPDVYGFTSVIASCAAEPGHKDEKTKAFNVALSTFRQLQGFEDGPNHVSYGAMLKACAKLLPSSSPVRQKWARKVFQDCCEAGRVGDMVISRMREAASPELYKELMNGHKRRELPCEWTCNVVETNEFRKRKSKPSVSKRKQAEI